MNFIPPQDETRLRAAASGVLPNGKPVVVNADGTVSVVASSSVSQTLGSPVVFESGNSAWISSAFDSNLNKVVIAYSDEDDSYYGKAVIGTVSGTSVSFGTPVVFYNSSGVAYTATTFDSNSNKVAICFQETSGGTSKAIVGTVSGTSISFGSVATLDSSVSQQYIVSTFDSTNNKIVVAYRDGAASNKGGCRVGTISGTDISFGSEVFFETGNVDQVVVTFDSNSNKVVVAYRDLSNSNYATCAVGTVSGTNISFGTPVIYQSTGASWLAIAFDSNSNKVFFAYADEISEATNPGRSRIGTVSGTTISIESNQYYFLGSNTGDVANVAAAFDSTSNKIVVTYRDLGNSNYGTLIVGTISGTAISFGTAVVFESAYSWYFAPVYDSNAGKVFIPYQDVGNSQYGTGIVLQNASTSTNLTAENYVGMSGGADKSLPATLGTGVVFESAATSIIGSTFDSNSNRIVISYRDDANSDYGTAVVGTVSGTSISFGTPVVFESAAYAQAEEGITFDSNSNKVVIAYNDGGNDQYATAIVGTVNPANNSISFGSAAVFNTASTDGVTSTFDSNSNKVVICFSQGGGKAVVATVSGTSISFGSVVVFESGSTSQIGLVFDSTANKVVVFYADGGDSSKGKARVGTVSGTNISFGTEAVFYNNETSGTAPSYDSFNNKVGLFYRKGNVSSSGFVVGTVSGTDISFGSEVALPDHMAADQIAHFDSERNLCVATYTSSANAASYYSASISGTTATIASPVVLDAGSIVPSSTFDSSAGKSVCSFRRNNSDANDRFGTAIVFSAAVSNRGEVASGSSASVDIIGTVSTNQTGLTPGQSYFVQTDGTITTTAGTPSVFAGTAISATKLLVKT